MYPFNEYRYNVNENNPPEIAVGVTINGIIDCQHKVIIERHVFTGHNILLLTGSHDYTKFGMERIKAGNLGGPITIHEGVWLASGCIVYGPCEIGKHSVIGAGAVVTGNVPPYAFVAGVPGRCIKKIPHSPEGEQGNS